MNNTVNSIYKYNANDMANQIHNAITYYQEVCKSLLDKERKTKEEIREEIKKEYEQEIQYLKDCLSLSIVSLNSEQELRDYYNFKNEHESCLLKSKIDGGKIPYVIQYVTGVGMCTTVYCQVCGKSKDITDTSVW